MKLSIMFLTMTALLTGCGLGVTTNQTALCDGLDPLAASHSRALVEDGGPKSVVTGATLIRAIDGGCGKEI